MIDKEQEYRKAFFFLKRYCKSPLTPSYTISYSRGLNDIKPAQKIYDYILMLGEDSSNSFKEKLYLLYEFLETAEREEQNSETPHMKTDFYRKMHSHITREKSNIEKGMPAQTRRL